MRESFSTGSGPFRKAYRRSLIDVIEFDDQQIRIKGSKDLLEKAVRQMLGQRADVTPCLLARLAEVPNNGQEYWKTRPRITGPFFRS
jgi:hypothetical protein